MNATRHVTEGRNAATDDEFFARAYPSQDLEKTQFDISRYYKIAYNRDWVLLAVRSRYNRELYSSKLTSFRSPLLIIIPTERLLTAAGVSVMRKTLPISGKNC